MLLVCHYRFHEYLSKFNGGIRGTCAARLYKTEVGNDGRLEDVENRTGGVKEKSCEKRAENRESEETGKREREGQKERGMWMRLIFFS